MSSEGWVGVSAIASPILSFAGASLGSRVSSRADNRLDKWRRREETGRTIRWAAEKAVDPDERVREVGYAALNGLAGAEILQSEDRRFLRLVSEAAIREPVQTLGHAVDTQIAEE